MKKIIKGKQISIIKKIIVVFLLVTAINTLSARVFASNSLDTIDVNGTTYDAKQYNVNKNSSIPENNALDKDELLRLLAAQMQNQDPLDPQDNSEYLAQLAQFSSLEQMTNVSSGLSRLENLIENMDSSLLISQLSNMVGKEICWQSEIEEVDENGKPMIKVIQYTGVVRGIQIVDEEPIVVAYDGESAHYVHVSDILSLSEVTTPENTASILSEGNLAIITAVSGVAIGFGLGGFLLGRKKKPALANGAKAEDEE